MRFFFVDPGLKDEIGHHANHCRYVTRELQARKIPTVVLGCSEITQALRTELDATPFFRAWPYNLSDGDPICGWLNAFFSTAEITRQDLARLSDIGRDDILFLSSGYAAQLMAVVQWAAAFPREKMPLIIVELGGEPGVDLQRNGPDDFSVTPRDPRFDPRAILYRFAATRLPPSGVDRFHVVTLDPSVSSLYTNVMARNVGVLPFITPATIPLRNRAGKRPITIAMLGHQRPDKGYHLMPEVVARLLREAHDIKILLHNSDADARRVLNPASMIGTQQKLRALAAANSRIILEESDLDLKGWDRLVEATDLMLCPYDPQRYAASHSGIASTAIANGIPLVVPAETSLAQWIREFGGPGTTFERFDAASVAEAVRAALDRFDDYATRAVGAADKWARTEGPANFMNAVLALRGGATPQVM